MTTLKLDKFVEPNDPVLTLVAQPVNVKDIQSEETQDSIKEMFVVAFGEQKDAGKPLLVGLAAPQIGISKRMILVDVIADGKGQVGDLRLYINPEIIESSLEEEEWYEGCFSTSRVCGIVARPVKIKIRAYTKEGEMVEEEHSNYTARIFQHEIDHLNGKEFTTHITDDHNLHWVEKEEFPKYRNEQGWRGWPNKCSREKWNKIKGLTGLKMTHEIETKVLDIDAGAVKQKLKSLGANKFQETRLIVDWYRIKGTKEGEDPWFLRIRSNSEGKHEVTWKAKSDILGIARKHKEINFIIPEPEKLSDLFEELGLEKYAHQEKDRVSFSYKDWQFDIDQYPNMPAYLEIEGISEESVKEAIKLLEIENNPTWAKGERILIQDTYGLDWYNMTF